jgi:hypothetical protein
MLLHTRWLLRGGNSLLLAELLNGELFRNLACQRQNAASSSSVATEHVGSDALGQADVDARVGG